MIAKTARSRSCRIAVASVGVVLLCVIAACKTTEGAGKDIENLGKDMQNSAEKHSP